MILRAMLLLAIAHAREDLVRENLLRCTTLVQRCRRVRW